MYIFTILSKNFTRRNRNSCTELIISSLRFLFILKAFHVTSLKEFYFSQIKKAFTKLNFWKFTLQEQKTVMSILGYAVHVNDLDEFVRYIALVSWKLIFKGSSNLHSKEIKF